MTGNDESSWRSPGHPGRVRVGKTTQIPRRDAEPTVAPPEHRGDGEREQCEPGIATDGAPEAVDRRVGVRVDPAEEVRRHRHRRCRCRSELAARGIAGVLSDESVLTGSCSKATSTGPAIAMPAASPAPVLRTNGHDLVAREGPAALHGDDGDKDEAERGGLDEASEHRERGADRQPSPPAAAPLRRRAARALDAEHHERQEAHGLNAALREPRERAVGGVEHPAGRGDERAALELAEQPVRRDARDDLKGEVEHSEPSWTSSSGVKGNSPPDCELADERRAEPLVGFHHGR